MATKKRTTKKTIESNSPTAPRQRRPRKSTAARAKKSAPLTVGPANTLPRASYEEIKTAPANSMMAVAAQVLLKGRKLWEKLLGERQV